MQEEVRHCLRLSEKQAEQVLAYLQRPFREAYIFISMEGYTEGATLMEPVLQGDDRLAVFRRFLTEPVIPSDSLGWRS